MREGIAPSGLVDRTVLYRTYRVLPLISGLKVGSLHDASAREAEHSRFQSLDCFRYVLAKSVSIPVESLDGEEGNVLHVHRLTWSMSLVFTYQHSTEFSLGGSQRRFQHNLILLPFR